MSPKEKFSAAPGAALSEAEVLFPEERVGEFILRPWTLQQFGELVGELLSLMERFQALGVDFAGDPGTVEMQARALELLPFFTPLFPRMVAVTLRLTPAAVEALGPGKVNVLGLRILLNKQNMAEIKNFFAGFIGSAPAAAPENPAPQTH